MIQDAAIRLEDRNGIRAIILSKSERRNALTPGMLAALRAAVAESGDCRGVVLLGEGATFCSGFDLALCEADPDGGVMRRLLAGLAGVIRAMAALPVPVVVGVQGAAIAGGCALLGGADAVVAEPAAKFGYPVVRLGVSPAVNAASLCGRVGGGTARRMLLDPGLIDAVEAERIGLVDRLVPADAVGREAVEWAERLSAKPRDAWAATKAWVGEVAGTLGMSDGGDAGLATSIGLAGGSEERKMLPAAWRGR